VSIVATIALLIGVGVPADAARAATPSVVTPVATAEDAPALPSIDEPDVQPELPEGAFDIPSPVDETVGAPQPVAPVAPPERTSAVAAWEKRSVPTSGMEVVAESEDSAQYRSPSGGTVTHLTTDPTRARDDDGDWVDVNTSVSRRGDEWTVADHPLEPVFRGGERRGSRGDRVARGA
jgi:hypothetical protein